MKINFWTNITKSLSLLVVLSLLSSLLYAQKDTSGTNVETLELSSRKLEIFNSYVGHLIPYERVSVVSEAAGTIERTRMEEGKMVKKGQALVNISTETLTIEVKLARSNYDLAVTELKTEQLLFDKQITTSSRIDTLRNRRDVSRYRLQLSEIALRKSKVKSPLTGIVKNKLVQEGEYVNRGQKLADLMNISKVLALVNIPEREMRFVSPGKEVSIRFDALPGNIYNGKVKTLGLEADLNNRSFPAEVVIDNPNRQLLPGMLARAEMSTIAMDNQIIIPRHAILEREDGRVVFVAENGKAVLKKVTLGTTIKDEVQIISGLKMKDLLIVAGHQLLVNKESISVIEAAQQTAMK